MILKLSNTCLTFLFSVKAVPANIIKIRSVISIVTWCVDAKHFKIIDVMVFVFLFPSFQ